MQKLSVLARFRCALRAFWKTLSDESFAQQMISSPKTVLQTADPRAALQLLALLQREGRLIDFLQEDLTNASDTEIGAAVRVVHAGCRKALNEHIKLSPICEDSEGSLLSLPSDFNRQAIRLTGNVPNEGPFQGTLIHPGWRVTTLELPQLAAEIDLHIVMPAEVEL